jgi:hypothetical protein
LARAIGDVEEAAADRLWYPDGVQLTDQGPQVFFRVGRAVDRLTLIDDAVLGPSLRDAIDLLLLVAATLARNEIEVAEARGDVDAVTAAEAEMDLALLYVADGEPRLAVERYATARDLAHLPPPRLGEPSDPAVEGDIRGLELARQTIFNPAVFWGVFKGRVDENFALGTWVAGVQHNTPLPEEPDESIGITGGQWRMQVWSFSGFRLRRVVLGGEITGEVIFDDIDLFTIRALMNVTSGGSGDILLDATLDHTVFPPDVAGSLSQPK